MSVQALSWVLNHSTAQGAERLVLISVANWAGKEPSYGAWESWPGIARIQREAGLSRKRTVQEAMARLLAAGALERVKNAGGNESTRGDRRPNLYRIPLASGVPCSDTRCPWCAVYGVPFGAVRGAVSRPNGVPFDGATGCREAAPEPCIDPCVAPSVDPPEFADFELWGRDILTADPGTLTVEERRFQLVFS